MSGPKNEMEVKACRQGFAGGQLSKATGLCALGYPLDNHVDFCTWVTLLLSGPQALDG